MSGPIKFDYREGEKTLKVDLTLSLNIRSILTLLIVGALSFGAYFLPLEGLNVAQRACLSIFTLAAGLWVTEAIPPFATSITVMVLSVFIFGKPDWLLQMNDSNQWQMFLNPVASPVLVLFFGGFILARAATKHGLDVRLAKAFVKPFGTRPSMVLLGVILTTALFSMFMSNTATTAMMIAIITPLLAHFEERQPFKKAIVLAVPFAANIGGIGTIIGTPPNAVAASVLEKMGAPINFLQWMLFGVPIVAVMTFVLWAVLIKAFHPRTDRLEILFPEALDVTWDLVAVVITFAATILLWLTGPLHGIPAAVVALLPIVVFTTLGILDRDDLKELDWDVLILVAGGMSLGVAMDVTGLSAFMVGKLDALPLGATGVLAVMMIVTLAFSNFMSNTAAAALLIPLASALGGVRPELSAVAVALAASLAMSLPISTPPNALAFATRSISTRDMATFGTIISLIGIAMLLVLLFAFQAIN